MWQTLSSQAIATIDISFDEDICCGAAIFEEGGAQVFKTVYPFEPCPIYVDICFTVASDHNFTLVSAGLQTIGV